MIINEISKQAGEKVVNKADRCFYWDGKIADKILKYCIIFKIVWEKYQYKGKTIVFFYDNIPKYDKSDEKYPKCKWYWGFYIFIIKIIDDSWS